MKAASPLRLFTGLRLALVPSELHFARAFGIVLICVAISCCYFRTFLHLVGRWYEADYSHGFFVPAIAGWLLWHRRHSITRATEFDRGRWLGVALIAGSGLLRLWAAYFGYVLLEAVALIGCLAGVPVLVTGFAGLRWALPSIAFLFFMVPLPGAFAGQMSAHLQGVATTSSTYLLQSLGIPAIATGNVIWLTNGKIGVVEACSGLRMLMMFAAVTMAAVLLFEFPRWEKACLLVSSIGIAILANVLRIVVTGAAHEMMGPKIADRIFHDLAGWLMMPFAIAMLGLEVVVLSKLFRFEVEGPVVVPRQNRTVMTSGVR